MRVAEFHTFRSIGGGTCALKFKRWSLLPLFALAGLLSFHSGA